MFKQNIIRVNLQDNGIDCGVFSLYNIELILNRTIGKVMKTEYIKKYRSCIYDEIKKYLKRLNENK